MRSLWKRFKRIIWKKIETCITARDSPQKRENKLKKKDAEEKEELEKQRSEPRGCLFGFDQSCTCNLKICTVQGGDDRGPTLVS